MSAFGANWSIDTARGAKPTVAARPTHESPPSSALLSPSSSSPSSSPLSSSLSVPLTRSAASTSGPRAQPYTFLPDAGAPPDAQLTPAAAPPCALPSSPR
eukprot:3090024-Pleurochrysis_carterae.AAC.1